MEVQQSKEAWAEWDRRATKEAEERKQRAQQRALELEAWGSTYPDSGRRRPLNATSRDINAQRAAVQVSFAAF